MHENELDEDTEKMWHLKILPLENILFFFFKIIYQYQNLWNRSHWKWFQLERNSRNHNSMKSNNNNNNNNKVGWLDFMANDNNYNSYYLFYFRFLTAFSRVLTQDQGWWNIGIICMHLFMFLLPHLGDIFLSL